MKFHLFKRIGITSALVVAAFFALATTVSAATYYFANTVDQSPTTLGNYWNDSGLSDHATQLPDFGVDEVIVLSEATFDGDIVFNGTGHLEASAVVTGSATFNTTYYTDTATAPSGGIFTIDGSHSWEGRVGGTVYGSDDIPITEYVFSDTAYNGGTITGTATFVDDATENSGIVIGTKRRRYLSDVEPVRNFTGWTVIADGAVVDLTGATLGTNTLLTAVNGGSFVLPPFSLTTVSGYTDEITLVYSIPLNSNSVPALTDFSITINGVQVTPTNISLTGATVTLTLPSAMALSDIVFITYTPGTTPLQVVGNVDVDAFASRRVIVAIPVSAGPFYFTRVGDKVYVGGSQVDEISVINKNTDSVVATIPTGRQPYYFATIGAKIYVGNIGDGTITVIDSTTDTVSGTITIGAGPYDDIVVNNKLYIVNQDDGTVSVIDTDTDTVVSTITVGTLPYYMSAVGTKIYVNNRVSSTVSVIDTTSDVVSTTINIPGGTPDYSTVVGTKLYVSNPDDNSVSVIDTTTDTLIDSIPVGDTPLFLSSFGHYVYVSNTAINDDGQGSVSIIDTTTDTVIDAILINNRPFFSRVIDNKVYVLNSTPEGYVSIINTSTNTIVDTVYVGNTANFSIAVDGKLYVGNTVTGSVSVINSMITESQLPNLTSFSTSSPSGAYNTGDTIPVTAHFGRTLQAGSTMTLKMNTGADVVLNNVSGTTLSGTYTIRAQDIAPDLFVRAIETANVSDTNGHTRTTYSIPASQGDPDIFHGENSFITRNLGDATNISINETPDTIDVGAHPYQISSLINGSIYVANQGAGTVSVIDATTHDVTSTITVGSEPYGLAYTNGQLYIANTGSDTVSVINTTTNTVVATIAVGVKPYYVATIGNNVYVTNGASNTVSVIDSNSNTVTATIPVGSYPRGIKAHGTDLYVANYGDPNYSGGNSVSVINSLNNTVTNTIILPAGSSGPRGVTVLGSKVYVANFRSDNVSVIDTATNTIVDTISVGHGPRGMAATGTTLYVENFDDGTISVIDTTNDTVIDTIDVGNAPSGITIISGIAYITSFQDNKVYKLDTTRNELNVVAVDDTDTTPPPTDITPVTIASGGFTPQPSASTVLCPPGTIFSSTTGKRCTAFTTTPAAGTIPFTRTLKLGMKGLDVQHLQQYLNTHNFIISTSGGGAPGHETMLFGTKTKAAVIKLQLSKGLKGDGVVGAMTRAVLK